MCQLTENQSHLALRKNPISETEQDKPNFKGQRSTTRIQKQQFDLSNTVARLDIFKHTENKVLTGAIVKFATPCRQIWTYLTKSKHTSLFNPRTALSHGCYKKT